MDSLQNIIQFINQVMISIILFQYNWSPLTAAACGGHLEVTRLLLDRGCDIDITTVCYMLSFVHNYIKWDVMLHVPCLFVLLWIKYIHDF